MDLSDASSDGQDNHMVRNVNLRKPYDYVVLRWDRRINLRIKMFAHSRAVRLYWTLVVNSCFNRFIMSFFIMIFPFLC